MSLFINKSALANQFGLSRAGFSKMLKRDPSFPKGLKLGKQKQCLVLFDRLEVEQWVNSKKENK